MNIKDILDMSINFAKTNPAAPKSDYEIFLSSLGMSGSEIALVLGNYIGLLAAFGYPVTDYDSARDWVNSLTDSQLIVSTSALLEKYEADMAVADRIQTNMAHLSELQSELDSLLNSGGYSDAFLKDYAEVNHPLYRQLDMIDQDLNTSSQMKINVQDMISDLTDADLISWSQNENPNRQMIEDLEAAISEVVSSLQNDGVSV